MASPPPSARFAAAAGTHDVIDKVISTPDLPITTPPDICAPKTTSNVVSIARSQLGTEQGAAADKYLTWAWPGLHTSSTPWCAGFASWVTNHRAGATTFKNLAVQNWVNAAKAGSNGLRRVSTPQAGDLIAFDWGGGGTPSVHRDSHPRNTNYNQLYIRIG